MKVWNRHTIPKDVQATYIGRGTPWGNPFVVGQGYKQSEAADAYRKSLAKRLAARDPEATDLVLKLTGVENILCSCTPRPCHGDCYAEIWNLIRDKDVKPLEGIRLWVKQNGYEFGPATDGIDHINIYTKGATQLGQDLSNLANIPVEIPNVGKFRSLEGYWYFLSTGGKNPELMEMGGWDAKKLGKTLEKVEVHDFQEKIVEAMRLKVEQNPDLKHRIIESSLPFTHYYHYGGSDMTVIYPPYPWIINGWEYIRKLLQGRWVRVIIAGSREKYWTDMKEEQVYQLLCETIKESGYEFDEVVCGGATGIDALGARYGREHGKRVKNFPADWDRFAKKAGIMRNIQMGDYADRAVVLIRGNSRGSAHMAQYMESLGKPCYPRHIAAAVS